MGLEETIRGFGDQMATAAMHTERSMEALNRTLDRLALAVEMSVPTLERLMDKMDETRPGAAAADAETGHDFLKAQLLAACTRALVMIRQHGGDAPDSELYRDLVDAIEAGWVGGETPTWINEAAAKVRDWRRANAVPADYDVPF